MCTGFPDLTLFYMSIYGGFGYDYCALGNAFQGLAAGIPQTGNPPFTVNDFLAMYPKFYGKPTSVGGTLTATSALVTGVASTNGVLAGQLVTGSGIPNGTIVLSTTSNTITLSQAVNASGSLNLSIYESQIVALAVIQLFLNLAYASLMQSRWRETWQIAMGWYIAHFLTLYVQSEGAANTTAGQIVANGLERGILVSKAVGEVSAGLQALESLGEWAAWTKTTYGTQLATFARVVGCGPIYVR